MTVVSTAIKYLEKLETLQLCETCNQPVFRLRRRGQVEVKSQAHFDRLEADFEDHEGREIASPVGKFAKEDPRTRQRVNVTLAIDTRDCIGCDVCVAHCGQGVLRMVDGKAMVDLRHLNSCDLDGRCVDVCPTNVVNLLVETIASPAELMPAAINPHDHDEAA